MLLHLLAYLTTILTGAAGTWFFTEVAKNIDGFNLSDASATTIRSVAGVLALVSTVLLSFVNHDISPDTVSHVVLAVLTFSSTWLGSHAIHVATQPTLPPQPPAGGAAA